MILQAKEGIEWLEFESLQEFKHITHGVFLRKGGVSEGACASLNISGKATDSLDNVQANRNKVRECLGIHSLVMSDQCHADQIAEVDQISNLPEVMLPTPSIDALFTKQKNMGLTVYHADCQAVLFYDPKQEVIANVHCGWRGNVQNILGKTVAVLQQKVSCNPRDLIVCISPSLGPSHAQFIHYKKEFPEEFYPYQKAPSYFDLWEISYQQLRKAGVAHQYIEVARMCTYAHEDLFFSYRRDKTTARNATVIGFKALQKKKK
jgi:polyphenol oxidase